MTNDRSMAVQGYVVDLACLRRYPEVEYGDRAQQHTTSCALMGHCVESGYALVGADGVPHLLDTHATPHVVAALRQSGRDQGVHVVAERRPEDGELVTTFVTEAPPSS